MRTIKITPRCDDVSLKDGRCCPVANEIKRVTRAYTVWAGMSAGMADNKLIEFPPELSLWINLFMAGKYPSPQEFTLEIP